MSFRPFRERLRRCPAGLLGMVVLVVLVEALLARHDDRFSNADIATHRFAGRAVPLAAQCEVLCFGDSVVKQGLMPQVLEARLGRPSYNLGVNGGMPNVSYLLLRRVLQQGGRPWAVVVDFKPTNLRTDPRGLGPYMAALATPREIAATAWEYRSADFAVRTFLNLGLASYRHRGALRDVVGEALGGEPSPHATLYATLWRNWSRNQGAQVNPPRSDHESTRVPPEWWDKYWLRDGRNLWFIVRFLELAKAHDVPVFWLVPPVHPSRQRRRDRSGVDGQYTEVVKRLVARFPNLCALDARRAGYPAERFRDTEHLDYQGAAALSGDVADAIARLRATTEPGRRFVALRRAAPPVPAPPLEDTFRSYLIVTGNAVDDTVRR